jgi:hypothetical protein
MERRLTIARAAVAPEREGDYLAALGVLAEAAKRDGRHLWVFRHGREPGRYVEFRESGGPWPPPTDEERPHLERLRALAAYEPGGDDHWTEIRLDRLDRKD